MTITIGWWVFPTIITLIGILWIFIPRQLDGGWFGGLNMIFRFLVLIPILIIWLVFSLWVK